MMSKKGAYSNRFRNSAFFIRRNIIAIFLEQVTERGGSASAREKYTPWSISCSGARAQASAAAFVSNVLVCSG
tara:strand:+ start:401 stop:619 length:219 start_codon:yes stop_codon:yes gene_type:complete